jgi:uncharacterized membrane protein YeaQ/YmgE (transglycosylase-associated protein family)
MMFGFMAQRLRAAGCSEKHALRGGAANNRSVAECCHDAAGIHRRCEAPYPHAADEGCVAPNGRDPSPGGAPDAQGACMLHFLWMLIVGLIAGGLAKLFMPGKDPGGLGVTLLLGLAGSFLAGFVMRAAGWYRDQAGAGIIASTIGAFVLLAIYRLLTGRGLGREDRRVGPGSPTTTR